MRYLSRSLTSILGCGILYAVAAPLAASAEGPVFLTAEEPALEWGPCPEFLPEGCRIAVLQGDPAGPNADVFFKVPAGADLPHHFHTSAERMILVSGELHLTFDGHPPRVMRTGSYAYGPAGLPHEGHCAEGDEPCILFIAFEKPVDAIPTEG
jgi:quercetin dioxygenase-like cupin family protein